MARFKLALSALAFFVSAGLPLVAQDEPVPVTSVTSEDFENLRDEIADLRRQVDAGGGGSDGGGGLNVGYKNGLNFSNDDGSVKVKLGGRIHLDFSIIDGDGDLENRVGRLPDGARFRRARFFMSGVLWDRFEYKAQYDFGGGDADFRDVYIGVRDLFLGTWRVGHYKEPFGLEELTSSNYITFMERGLPNGVFTPVRNIGLSVRDNVEVGGGMPMTYAVGVFLDDFGDNYGNSIGDSNYAGTGRVTLAPVFDEDQQQVVHIGGAYSIRNPSATLGTASDALRFRQRPEARQAGRFVDTGNISANVEHRFGLEGAFVTGPFSMQAEFMASCVDGKRGATDPFFYGLYLFASYFVTGESRPYDSKKGVFGRVKPNENWLEDGGIGAWELTARYSRLDLDAGRVQGGVLNDISGGVNWYWNPQFRMMFNYVYSELESVGDAHMFLFRWQVSF